LWPDVNNAEFKAALAAAAEGESPNNISPIIRYSLEDGVVALWMGDLGSEFLEAVQDELDVPKVDVLFAPHHGRDSGKVPASLLEKMSPRLIIIGEAPSEHLHYYPGYHTITQNSAGDIIFACEEGAVHIFTSNVYDVEFLDDQHKSWPGYYYVGTLKVSKR
jgi:beta-lactamase superfamily II metal-dependent hydrolase